MKFKNYIKESKIPDDELLEWLLTYLARKAIFDIEVCSQIKKEAEHEKIKISPQRIRKVLEKFGFAKGSKSEKGERTITGSVTKQWDFKPSEICLTKAGRKEVFNRFKKVYKQKWVIVGNKLMKRDEFIKKMDKEINEGLKDFLSRKDSSKLGIGSQYILVGIAGKMGLYQNKTFTGTTRGSSSWAIDFGGGNILTFADKPSIDRLIKLEYPVPKGSPKKWKKK